MSLREEKSELIAPVGHRPVRQQMGLFKRSALLYAVIAAAGYASWVYVRQCDGTEKTAAEDVSLAKFDWGKVSLLSSGIGQLLTGLGGAFEKHQLDNMLHRPEVRASYPPA